MPTLTYPHWRDVPATAWRWPNFSAAEIACRGTGAIKINTEAMDKLQALRDRLGKPLIIRSAYRSPEHNQAVGGAPASKHMQGTAFDIAMANHDPVAFAEAARAVGFLGFGSNKVLLTPDEIEVLQDQSGTYIVQTSLTPEALDGRPEYKAEQ